uniref:BRCT domain-containing protein n=1 Tax=Guillardia theta TaxID=55529 RepID=A0A7S4JKA4_GUITH|mmetsp:Transcript_17103/g.56677  ORF Transcript_17103/g.56677 Transcript_17103/m.56677 type:complete len:754 (+) Transcript_17103:89-2350(+)
MEIEIAAQSFLDSVERLRGLPHAFALAQPAAFGPAPTLNGSPTRGMPNRDNEEQEQAVRHSGGEDRGTKRRGQGLNSAAIQDEIEAEIQIKILGKVFHPGEYQISDLHGEHLAICIAGATCYGQLINARCILKRKVQVGGRSSHGSPTFCSSEEGLAEDCIPDSDGEEEACGDRELGAQSCRDDGQVKSRRTLQVTDRRGEDDRTGRKTVEGTRRSLNMSPLGPPDCTPDRGHGLTLPTAASRGKEGNHRIVTREPYDPAPESVDLFASDAENQLSDNPRKAHHAFQMSREEMEKVRSRSGERLHASSASHSHARQDAQDHRGAQADGTAGVKRPGKKGGWGGVSAIYDLPDSDEQRADRDESPNIFEDDTPALARASTGMQEEEDGEEEEGQREEQWREEEVSGRGKRTRKQEVITTKAQAKRSKISPTIASDPPPTISQLRCSREARGSHRRADDRLLSPPSASRQLGSCTEGEAETSPGETQQSLRVAGKGNKTPTAGKGHETPSAGKGLKTPSACKVEKNGAGREPRTSPAEKQHEASPSADADGGSPMTRRRGSPTKKGAIKPCILLVGFAGDELDDLNRKVKDLGGEVAQHPEKCSHIVALRLKTSFKLLAALVLGHKLVLSRDWVDKSHKKKTWQDEETFWLKDRQTEERHNFNLQRRCKEASPLLFKNIHFTLSNDFPMKEEEAKFLIEKAGGTLRKKGTEGSIQLVGAEGKSSKAGGGRRKFTVDFIRDSILQNKLMWSSGVVA